LVREGEAAYGSEWAASCAVAEMLGPTEETVRASGSASAHRRDAGRLRAASVRRAWFRIPFGAPRVALARAMSASRESSQHSSGRGSSTRRSSTSTSATTSGVLPHGSRGMGGELVDVDLRTHGRRPFKLRFHAGIGLVGVDLDRDPGVPHLKRPGEGRRYSR
jgi:hypothetical protein